MNETRPEHGAGDGENLQFHYAGLAGESYSSRDELPNDGTLYYILNGNHQFGNMVAGAGGYSGSITHRIFVFVHAVNIANGHTFSSMSNHKGEFVIPIASPGKYRVFAKGFESSAFDKTVAQSPSWYVSHQQSTNDPTAGKVFSLTPPVSQVKDLQIAMLEQPVSFNFFWSLTVPTSSEPVGTFVPSFLRPGHSVRFKLICNGGTIPLK